VQAYYRNVILTVYVQNGPIEVITCSCRAILIRNVVQERLPMVSQLMEGLKPCGILAAIQTYPDEMRPLFCINDTGEKLHEDKFMSLFEVNFSQEQQKKGLGN